MKTRDAKRTYTGAVNCKYEVTVVPPEGRADTDELRRALATIDRYKKAALKALGLNEKEADWTLVEFGVKTDCVEVWVQQGSCG